MMAEKIKFTFTAQAAALIRQTKDFDMRDFISYLRQNGVPVGSSNILEYLMVRDGRERGPDKSPEPEEVLVDA